MLSFTIDGYIPPSGNQQLRKHWAARKREQDKLKWAVVDAIAATGDPLPPEYIRAGRPMRMTVRCFRIRRLDTDNAMAGIKPLVDVVKELGIIHDDSPAWLDLGLDQRIDAARPRVEIDIEPMAGTPRSKSKRR